jgi:hypothetical protein
MLSQVVAYKLNSAETINSSLGRVREDIKE